MLLTQYNFLPQACFCNIIICCRGFYLPLCWDGCIRHWKMEIRKWKVSYTWLKMWVVIVNLCWCTGAEFHLLQESLSRFWIFRKDFKWCFMITCSTNYLFTISLFTICFQSKVVLYRNLPSSCSPGKSIAASAVLFGLVLVGRASFIFPLSFLSNFTKKSKSDKFDLKQQVLFGVSLNSLASR